MLSSRFGSYGMVSSSNLSNSTFFVSAKSPSPPHASPEWTLPGIVGIRTIYPLAMASGQQPSDEQLCMELMDFMMQCISLQVSVFIKYNDVNIIIVFSYLWEPFSDYCYLPPSIS